MVKEQLEQNWQLILDQVYKVEETFQAEEAACAKAWV